MIKIDGELDDDLTKDGWVACEIKACSLCEGSGWDYNHAYSDKDECERCDNSGFILDLSTAIACKVTTTVEIR